MSDEEHLFLKISVALQFKLHFSSLFFSCHSLVLKNMDVLSKLSPVAYGAWKSNIETKMYLSVYPDCGIHVSAFYD